MKACEYYSEFYSDYVEGNLSDDELKPVEEHLHSCPSCQENIVRIQNLRKHLRELPSVKTAPDFETILRIRIKPERRAAFLPISGRLSFDVRMVVAYSMAALLLILSTYYLIKNKTDVTKHTPPLGASLFSDLKIKYKKILENDSLVISTIEVSAEDIIGDSSLRKQISSIPKMTFLDIRRKNEKPNYEMIDKIINKLKYANIAFNTPDSMKIGETTQVVLLMSTGLSRIAIASKIPSFFPDTTELRKIHTDSVKVSSKMEALLSGEGFTITPVTKIQQYVLFTESTRWEWIVRANKPEGNKILYLTLNAFISNNGEETTQTIQTYRKVIFVYVESTTVLLEWFENNLAWIAGILGSITTFLLGYYLKLREKRKEVQKEGPKIIRPNQANF